MPKLSINLLTHNDLKYLPSSLDSIERQIFQDYSVLIIDNASDDGTQAWLGKYFKTHKNKDFVKKIRFVQNKKNLGYVAHNQGIIWTNSLYLLLLNPDVVMQPDFAKKLVKFLDKSPQAGAVTGKLLKMFTRISESNEAMLLQDSQSQAISSLHGSEIVKSNIIDSLGLKIFKAHRIVELGAGRREKGTVQDTPVEIFGVSGAAPMYRRRSLEEAALTVRQKQNKNSRFQNNNLLATKKEYFDPDFFCYKEDVDLAYRLRLAGWQAWLVPSAVGCHDRTAQAGSSTVKNRKQKSSFVNFHSYKNHLFFLIKNTSRQTLLKYGYKIFFYELKKFVYLFLFEQKTLKALKEMASKLSLMLQKRKIIMESRKAGEEEIVKWFN